MKTLFVPLKVEVRKPAPHHLGVTYIIFGRRQQSGLVLTDKASDQNLLHARHGSSYSERMTDAAWLRKLRDLESGNPRQRAVHRLLKSLNILNQLADFTPILAGTIPIDVDIPSSDLDIICSAKKLDVFATKVTELYGHLGDYKIESFVINTEPTVIARFAYDDFEFELFAQAIPSAKQNAVIHMLAEAKLLSVASDIAQEDIRTLKLSGVKTEPAFAEVFELEGDPFEVILQINQMPPEKIRSLVPRRYHLPF